MIKPGDAVPAAKFKKLQGSEIKEIATDELFKERKIVVFGVPGAFTPTCHLQHLPGYIENSDALLAKGVDEIAVIAVNDPFVMSAWARSTDAEGKVLFLADPEADFTRSIGMDIDLRVAGLGTRSKRYSAVITNGVVEILNLDEDPGQADRSQAKELLRQL
nr:peroxiredoxin [Mesorhizobium sp. IRAMC:0171]